MNDKEREEIEKVAKDLVYILTHEGTPNLVRFERMVKESILTQVEKARAEALEEAAKAVYECCGEVLMAEDMPHPDTIVKAIRTKLEKE